MTKKEIQLKEKIRKMGGEVQMTKERAEELIEVFADADRRADLTEAEINACPAIDEVLEAVHGA